MVNQSSSSSYPILCASFNQDNSCFAIATRDGIKIFDANSGRLCYERAIGAFVIVEMLYASSLLAIVGAGEQASLSPRRLCLFNITTGNALRDLNFLTSILAVRVNRKRLVVTLQEKTYIYDINSLDILDTIDTVPNFKGLCAFSPSLDGCFLALPASATKGSVLVYNVMEHHSHCEIDAHRSPLTAMVLSSNGMYIATASEQGTIIRVHLVSDATKQSYSFRRGTYPSTIFSLSFGPSMQLPDILVATSSSGSVHAFPLGFALNQSYAVIRKVDKVAESSMSESAAYRATISLITYSGYFLEYSLSINHQNESSWILEREFNLLTVISECVNS
ncbi:autophagy-related protein 18b-like isoform X4 [Camellia sinensis]|uniref:autophagy-related protein 18b-like isoform X4 n=1 Tax=Camellia sinensis TaxID=4442 RepID=UPI0010355B31|nr:autophagy-related protein 18b-like isoform X4 [Camellia sinensis]